MGAGGGGKSRGRGTWGLYYLVLLTYLTGKQMLQERD